MRAEAGRLDAAERDLHLGAGRLGVDVQETGLRLVREPLRRFEVLREDGRGEAELDGVRPAQPFVEVADSVERRHRPEHLLARQERVVADALEDRRLDHIPGLVGAPAAGDHLAAFAATARTRGSPTMALPTCEPEPVSTFSTPGGSPASARHSARCSPVTGASVASFSTTALP